MGRAIEAMQRLVNATWSAVGGLGASAPAPDDDFWYSGFPSMGSATGVLVTPEAARRVGVAYSCVKVIAETVGALPLHLYQPLPGGRGREKLVDHHLVRLLGRRPNGWQTPMMFREMLTGHAALRGNGYAQIIPGPRGTIAQLVPLSPTRMRVEQMPNGLLRYRYQLATGPERLFRQDEILHLRGFGDDGISGLSPVAELRETFGMAIAARDYGARFFKNAARPSGVLEHPGHFKDEPTYERFKKTWRESQTGEGQHSTAILEDGLKWTQLGMSNEDAQYLETRRYQDVDICRIWRVPPHKVAIMDHATFGNIEHQSIEFVQDCILTWCIRWEQALAQVLLPDEAPEYFKHNLAGLLRGDIKTRYQAYFIGRQGGWLSANDVLEMEDSNPIEGGDEYLSPLNMTPAGTGGGGRRAEDPEDRSAAEPDLAAQLAGAAAGRLVRREVKAIARATSRVAREADFDIAAWLRGFWEDQARAIAEQTGLDVDQARAWLADQESVLAEAMGDEDTDAALDAAAVDRTAALKRLILNKGTPDGL